VSTAPETVRFCLTCGGSMATLTVHGVDRRVCDDCRRIHYADPKVAVGVAVFRDDGLLLVRRTMNPGRGRWALPGGFLDAGEDPRVAAARETSAEGGAIFILYAAQWRAGEPQHGDDCDGAAFFRRTELPPLAFASTLTAVGRWPGRTGQ
jgi:ADP-ribose pyrophosphatase YjhB (NUDIX family)